MDRTNTFEHSMSCPKRRHCLKSFSGDSPAVHQVPTQLVPLLPLLLCPFTSLSFFPVYSFGSYETLSGSKFNPSISKSSLLQYCNYHSRFHLVPFLSIICFSFLFLWGVVLLLVELFCFRIIPHSLPTPLFPSLSSPLTPHFLLLLNLLSLFTLF